MSKLSRKEREKMQRRNEIINAAEKRFFQKGFDQVSMDEIAQDLELSKPTLYLYFENKEALFLEVIIRGMSLIRDLFKNVMEQEKTGKGKTLAFIHAFFDYCRKNPDYYRLLIEARTMMLRTRAIDYSGFKGARRFGELALEAITLLKDSIQLGTKDGTLRKDLDPLQTAIFLSIACEGAFQITPDYRYLMKQGNVTLDQYLQHSIEVMMHGIAVAS